VIKYCKTCEEQFETDRHRVYCSRDCAKRGQRLIMDAYNKTYRGRAPTVKTCDVCHKLYERTAPNQKYCSQPCQYEGWLRTVRRQREKRRIVNG
jgi:hypothetical protein